MTENEAKAFLKIEKQCINRNCDRNCAHCDIVQKVEDLNNAYDTAIQALEEVQQYREIGIVDECWSAMEKQKEKKPLIYQRRKYCIVCGEDVGRYFGNFCRHCGQHIDWSDEDGKVG